jgi:hypothetical protein
MKKSLVLLVVLLTSLAVASSACAFYGWDCYEMPKCKVVCKDQVLCKGKAAGTIGLCGPAMCDHGKITCPSISYAGSWITLLKCPAVKK